MSKQHEKIAQRALATEVHRDGFEGDPELNESLIRNRARAKRNEIKLIRQRLAASIDGQIRSAADAVVAAGDHAMGDSAYAAFRGRLNRASEAAQVDRLLAELEDGYESRGRDARVVKEPRVYGPESPNSYFADIGALVAGESEVGAFRHNEAADRLSQHSVEVSYEIRAKSKEGRRAERVLHEMCRVADVDEHRRRAKETIAVTREQRASDIRETRALLTGGGITAAASSSASVFVSPIFVSAAWAPFRSPQRVFADCCGSRPLPPYGMQAYVPGFTSTTGTGQQTEGSSVSETDPSTALQGAAVANVAGQITLSMQIHDRGYLGAAVGGGFDAELAKQLGSQLDSTLDIYVINNALSGAGVVTDTTAPATATWVPNLLKDLALAREVITDTAGVRMRPTHLFTSSDVFSYATRQTDSATAPGRPILVPQYNAVLPQVNGADDGLQPGGEVPPWSRFSGLMMAGNVAWMLDDNLPASGSNQQLVVSATEEAILLMESPEPILTAFVQTDATNLEVVLNLRRYVVAIARHASGTAVISGAAYPTATLI